MVNVAFIVSHNRTVLFRAVAEKLEKDGHVVYWLSPSRVWSRWLMSTGVDESRILQILFPGNDEPEGDCQHRLSRYEVDLTYNAILLSDRVMKALPPRIAQCVFADWADKISNFISSNEIALLLSEKTWAIELISDQVCKKLGIPTFNPHTVRIPATRFAFFNGWSERDFFSPFEPGQKHFSSAEALIQRFRATPSKPWYYYRNNSRKISLYSLAKKYVKHALILRNSDRGNPTRSSAKELVLREVVRQYNRVLALSKAAFHQPKNLEQYSPYILLTLHRQPEASIDVLAHKLSNQLEAIKALVRSLPSDYTLLVKEHSNAIGDRSMAFYNAVARLPNTILIHPMVDSLSLIKSARFVLSATGTASFEAALLGVPAATMVEMFFSPILVRPQFNPYVVTAPQIRDIIESKMQTSDEQRVAFMARIMANSFDAVTVGPDINPIAMDEQNIHNFYSAISMLIDSVNSNVYHRRTSDAALGGGHNNADS